MKKITSAAVAASIGAALLLGGAGTLAYWSDTKTSQSQNISSGNLVLGDITESTNWTIKRAAGGNAVSFNAGSDKIVPGDVLTQTVLVPVTLIGTNLAAKLSVATPNVTGNLKDQAQVAVATINGQAAGTGVVLDKNTNGKVPVTVTVTFPFGTKDTAANQGADRSLSISAAYTLEQVETPAK